MKRFLSGGIAVLMLCSLLAGCGDKDKTAASGSAATAAASGSGAPQADQPRVQAPGEVLKAYVSAMAEEKVDDALKLVYVPDFSKVKSDKASPEMMQKSFTNYVTMRLYESKFNLDKMGGLDSVTTGKVTYFSKGADGKGVEVQEADVKEGSIARVAMTLKLKTGKSNEAAMMLMRAVDGWKVLVPIEGKKEAKK